MKDTTDIDNQIKELESKIQELKAEKKRLSLMPENQRLAEAIHSKQCHWNHTDGCGWYYEKWDSPSYSKNEYLKKANAMLAEMSFEQAMKVIKFL